jgi:DNA-binding Xre family transcriptional regulator
MYSAQIIKNRIKALCKSRKVNMTDMLQECELGVNAIRQINDTKGMASFSLAKIADYLDCSIDYLVGRTNCPDVITIDDEGNYITIEAMSPPKDES